MLAPFADPRIDFVFRRVFGTEDRKPLLLALLDALLELEGPRSLRDVEHLPRERRVAVPELRRSTLPVTCADTSGRQFLVAMRFARIEGLDDRAIHEAGKTYVRQPPVSSLCDLVVVTICNFVLWPEKDEHGRFEVPLLSRWRSQDQPAGAVEHVFLELPRAGDDPQTPVERWAWFFRETKNLNVVPPALSEAPFREALEVTRTSTFTPQERELYERAKMAEQDARGALSVARREGREEGFSEGRAAALLAVLAARGLSVSAEVREHIEVCRDAATLDQWIGRAVVAASADEVIAPPPDQR